MRLFSAVMLLARGPTTIHKIFANLLPPCLYTTLSVFFFGEHVSWSSHFFGGGWDPLIFVWMIHWWPFAILHGFNPFISQFVWFPQGANLTWDTSIPALALLSAPITAIKGSLFSFNILSVFASAIASSAAFFLLRYVTRNWLASVIGGYIFGFSSYELAQAHVHLNLSFTCCIPLAVLMSLLRYHQKITRRTYVIGLCTVMLFQLGVSTEILLSFCFFSAVAWLIFVAYAGPADRLKLLSLARDTAITAIPTLIISFPFWYFLIKGIPEVPSGVIQIQPYTADPLNYLIPTFITDVMGMRFKPLSSLFYGRPAEQGAYLGLPMLILLLNYYIQNRREPHIKAAYTVIVLLSLCSLGPTLHILNFDSQLSLPWAIFAHIPIVQFALPARFTLYVALLSSILVALYLSQTASRSVKLLRFLAAFIVCVTLMPNRHLFKWEKWPQQDFFSPNNIEQTIGKNKNVLILPFAVNGPGMAWQIDSGMSFTQTGGYIGFPPKSNITFDALGELYSGQPGPQFASDFSSYCAHELVDDILVGPGTPRALVAQIEKLGWPETQNNGVTIFKVPPAH